MKSLQRAGFDMRRISVIGRDYSTDEQVLGFFNAADRAKFFGKYGAFWGGLFGILFGAAFLFVPVVGHIVVFGPLAATIVGGLEGAAVGGGVSALLGALSAIGVPRNSVLRYATAIRADRFLMVVHGDASEIQRARPARRHRREQHRSSPGERPDAGAGPRMKPWIKPFAFTVLAALLHGGALA